MKAEVRTVDNASAELILEIQIQDLHTLLDDLKGKERKDQPNDITSALQLQLAEHEQARAALKDRRVCLSLAEAVHRDAAVLGAAQAEESQSRSDRELAHTLAGRVRPPHASDNVATLRTVPDGIIAQLSPLNTAANEGGPIIGYANPDAGEGSSQYFSARALEENTKRNRCACCFEIVPHFETRMLECGDIYCTGCIRVLFGKAITDETLYPPRCCRIPISLESVRELLGEQLFKTFVSKTKEWETPDRIYCPDSQCSAFIPPTEEGNTYVANVQCPDCGNEVCRNCKQGSHGGACNQLADKQVRAQLRAIGFQQCECGHMVELSHGCLHMTCRCKREFCYICAATWKTCKCPLFDELGLLRQAQNAVDPGLVGGARDRAIEEMRRVIQERHDCAHLAHWTRMRGTYACEVCTAVQNKFILQCPECGLLACVRCKMNRL